MKIKTVYVPMAVDLLHEGHLKILKFARKLGKVTVGLMTDKAISEYKSLPILSYDQRYEIIRSLKYVDKVIKQDTWDYVINLNKIKPNYFVHGDDWKNGVQKYKRLKVIKILKKWDGKLVELKYSKNISSGSLISKIKAMNFSSDDRKEKFSRLIKTKNLIRILECHSPLTGLIIENLSVVKFGKPKEFDGMWSSSLTDSVLRGMPDNQSVDYSTRVNSINEILNVTTKPLIFDIDNGGRIEHLEHLLKKLERSGVSAIIMEDKTGLKSNSLLQDQTSAKQDSIKKFTQKIRLAKQVTKNNFFIIPRIESFILGKSLNDALKRAEAYSKAGADFIMIHSKEKTSKEVFKFADMFMKSRHSKPLVAVPSTYSKTYEKELVKKGFKIVIYANQLLRSSYKSMFFAAKEILKKDRAYDIEKKITPIKDILNLIK